jgi:lipoprotein NlpD
MRERMQNDRQQPGSPRASVVRLHAMRAIAKTICIAGIVALLAGCGSSRIVQGPRAGSAARPAPVVKVSKPKYGATHLVRRGETVYRIATNNGITALDLALWNSIPPPYTIHPGQRLKLYPGGPTYPQRPVASRPAPAGAARPAPQRPASSQPAPVYAPAQSNLGWRWPTEGQLIARFVSGDPTKQGIDVAGTGGQPVRAAADGVVVYSGSGLVGYGELIIVKHNEQWLSAYGHNRARLVNEGALVKAGQQIAEMGRSGAARDMLHFEIRYNGKPVDPLQYLPKR